MNTNFGLLRVAAAVPQLKVADPDFNTRQIIELVKKAAAQKVTFAVFPELCLTGYTCADLFNQKKLREHTLKNLALLLEETKDIDIIFLVGLPLFHDDKLYNVAAVISRGEVRGFVPKIHLPNYKEFYEARWFASGQDLKLRTTPLFGRYVPIGTDLLFEIKRGVRDKVKFGVEICEDLWVPIPPSSFQALHGAALIANLSASNAIVGKAGYRRNLVTQQSGRLVAGYIYSSCGVHESTTDVSFDGHALIAENGSVLAESKRFAREEELVIADLDIEHLLHDRAVMSTFQGVLRDVPELVKPRVIPIDFIPEDPREVRRANAANPFVPSDPKKRDENCAEIFAIQTAGLAKRLGYVKSAAKMERLVLGLSGGLDSTLALLVAVKALQANGIPKENMHAFTLPGFGTTSRTKDNAITLGVALGVSIEEVDITKAATQALKDLAHESEEDTTYENVQARYRTNFLMNKANQLRALVVGTGDMSESALGWCTFAGDHISFYNPNAGVPKTLVKYLVQWIAETQVDARTRVILEDIIATPISPELLKAHEGQIAQKTEEKIGPYELHDFFLYHFLRWGSSPKKIMFLAEAAWKHKYNREEIKKWLGFFLDRFFKAQWKRSVASDGPKVGSVSLSPRGDWRMPSDAEMKIWLDEVEEI